MSMLLTQSGFRRLRQIRIMMMRIMIPMRITPIIHLSNTNARTAPAIAGLITIWQARSSFQNLLQTTFLFNHFFTSIPC